MIDLLELKDGDTIKVPREACQFLAEDLRMQPAPAGQKTQRFAMLAHTGKAMPHWFFRKMVVELSGISFKQKLPVLKDHDTEQRLGFTDKIALDERGLVAEGNMLDSELSAQVKNEAAQGFPWQASVHLEIGKVQVLREGEDATVNGQQFSGPGAIVRQSTLREVTFTALGADDNTSAMPLSRNGAGEAVTAIVMRQGKNMAETPEGPPDPNKTATPKATEKKGANGWKHSDEALRLARDEARQDEKERILQILLSAAPVHQRDLALQLIGDDVPANEALVQINQDLREQLGVATSAQKPQASRSLARGNSARVAATPAEDNEDSAEEAKLKAMPEGAAKWTKQYEASPALQKEFGDVKYYVAFKQNEDKCSDFGMPQAGMREK